MISEQLNKKPQQKIANKEFYGIEALSQPKFDLSAIKEIKLWLIYRITDSEYQFLELNSQSIANAQQLVIEYSTNQPEINTESSVVSGEDLFATLLNFDQSNGLRLVDNSRNLTKIKLT